ncbi:oligopeptidase A [Sessilibacter corallicola]|uniref:oligopeptidase A n=1 Tax=Sessilibacter corallicola TaxID=2904075 RepID=UPI001E5AECB6|nr:oligopeptidase A [Sessilibacter corallicola]MCE2028077.1 oligopeptidase A [Sessilibacter corallicola]
MSNTETPSTADNPLLANPLLPPFESIKPEHVVGAIDQLITRNKEALETLLAANEAPTWDNLFAKLEANEDELGKAWSPVSHLNGVLNSQELREAYNQALMKLTQYGTELGQHQGLYQAYQQLVESESFQSLSQAHQKAVQNSLRDFTLSGIGLPKEQQAQFAKNSQRLSELSSQFSNNVLDATHAWHKHFTDESALAGLPDSALALAKQAAQNKQLEGFVVTLDIPSYLAVMTYAQDRSLREEMYRAYCTRASEFGTKADGSSADEWDNSDLILETLKLRQQQAELLGFANYAELSLAKKMAKTPAQVEEFLLDLADRSRAMAEQELSELKAFAAQDGITDYQPWDASFYSEQLKQEQHSISQESLRPYFPADKVVNGLFTVANKLFGLDIAEDSDITTWHNDAKYYTVSREGQQIAGFYLDLYAREHKRGGAWMDECRVRRRTQSGMQLPVAYLTCNFNPPSAELPSLLTHDEVTTLFHEFGHGLHHMLTEIDVAAVSGINGVEWDAVELPSQFLENWCWHPDVIALLSGHFETNEPLPKDLLDKMLAAKNFQSGMQMLRQIEFALFDLRLHWQYPTLDPVSVSGVLNAVRERVAVITPPDFNRFENGFSHIFAGGYAAGYYSYKWAEVLSSDAFSVFEENGIFDADSGKRFLTEILQKGGSKDANELFVAFRGRDPNTDALLRHSGIRV